MSNPGVIIKITVLHCAAAGIRKITALPGEIDE
jgi:hypothetical protein